jgi:DNA mismatch repair protein MutL
MKGMAPGMSREERILATIACHSAVKLGDKLSRREMEALIKEWLSSCYPATGPHGRLICYRIDHKDIARKLDRHYLVSTSARTSPGTTYIQTVRTAHRVNC